MASSQIHVDDIAVLLRSTLKDENGNPVDISSASTKQFIIVKPDGTKVTKDTSFITDGTDGKMGYTVESGVFNLAGVYRVQSYIKIGSKEFHSNISTFKVYDNL